MSPNFPWDLATLYHRNVNRIGLISKFPKVFFCILLCFHRWIKALCAKLDWKGPKGQSVLYFPKDSTFCRLGFSSIKMAYFLPNQYESLALSFSFFHEPTQSLRKLLCSISATRTKARGERSRRHHYCSQNKRDVWLSKKNN